MPWDPDRYHQFRQERSAPFYDLLTLVRVRPGMTVVDLGCGTGENTLALADTLPGADVLGLDHSPDMLARARTLARPGLRFEPGDQAALSGRFDLIISNAALQWSDDHPGLLGRLFDCLNPGGQLAVQVPSNHGHLTHQLVRQTAAEEPFHTALAGWMRTSPVLPLEDYARILFDLGAQEITVFEKIYPHVLADADAVLDWLSGTALVPYFERLGALRQAFLERLGAQLRRALPGTPVFYPFRRTFFSASKAGQA